MITLSVTSLGLGAVYRFGKEQGCLVRRLEFSSGTVLGNQPFSTLHSWQSSEQQSSGIDSSSSSTVGSDFSAGLVFLVFFGSGLPGFGNEALFTNPMVMLLVLGLSG